MLTGAALLSLPFFFAGGALATHEERIQHNFVAKELRTQTLAAQGRAEGFVYYKSRFVTQGCFERVDVYEHGKQPDRNGKVAAVFAPKVARANQLMPSFAWQKRQVLLVVEWTAKTPDSGNVLWVSSIEGAADEAIGNVFTGGGHEKKLFQDLFDDLTRKTVVAFSEAPELRRLAVSGK